MKSLRVRTPAKINLFLRVVGTRPDGYHNLETLFQAIDLHDELIISETAGASRLEVPGRPALENNDNLIMHALHWIERRSGRRFSVNIRLKKRIPVAAGLGGGSSDAAATILGIEALYDLELGTDDVIRDAGELGADVPFFLVGGSAVGEGIGERLRRVSIPLDYALVLVHPGFPVSTAAIFRDFDRILTGKRRHDTLWPTLESCQELEELLHNDLQPVTEVLHPEISEIRNLLEKAGATRALMTGSGPTIFGIARPDRQEAERIREKLPAEWNTQVAMPQDLGVLID
jgi:4-diphosphocytidyl-2-C-methyl-D-erythritol kinase